MGAFVGQSELFEHGKRRDNKDDVDGKQAPVALVRTTVTNCFSGGEAVSESKNVESDPPSVITWTVLETFNDGKSLSIIVAEYETSDN